MARRTVRAGFGLGFGGGIGLFVARVFLVALGVAFLVAWFLLSAAGMNPWVALALLVCAVLAVPALWLWGRDLDRLGGQWASRHRRVRTGGGGDEWAVSLVPFEGVHYTWYDHNGVRRYDGSAGDERDLAARFRDHCNPDSRSALAGKIGPGWTFGGEVFDTRQEAYDSEALAIRRHMGSPGYENRRLEGRGQVTR